MEWFGNARGYNITYSEVGRNVPAKSVAIEDHTANSYILKNLEEFTQYEVIMSAFNDVGTSDQSPKATERTRESGNPSLLFMLFLFVNLSMNTFCLQYYSK